MDYVQPLGGAAGAPYIDANPALGIEGSAVPAAAIEHPMREIMSVITGAGMTGSGSDLTQLKQAIERLIDAQSGNYALDTGVANAYVVALNPAVAVYGDGMTVRVKIINANTGASTLNAGGGAVALVNDVGAALAAGDLPAGGIATATYIAAAGKFYLTSLVQSQGDARYAALAGLVTQLFSVAAATGAGNAVNLGQFLGSPAASGYLKIPFWNGTAKENLIIQWGTILTDASGAQTLTHPVSFPNNNFSTAMISGTPNVTSAYTSLGLSNFSIQFYIPGTGVAAGTCAGRYISVGK